MAGVGSDSLSRKADTSAHTGVDTAVDVDDGVEKQASAAASAVLSTVSAVAASDVEADGDAEAGLSELLALRGQRNVGSVLSTATAGAEPGEGVIVGADRRRPIRFDETFTSADHSLHSDVAARTDIGAVVGGKGQAGYFGGLLTLLQLVAVAWMGMQLCQRHSRGRQLLRALSGGVLGSRGGFERDRGGGGRLGQSGVGGSGGGRAGHARHRGAGGDSRLLGEI